MKVMKCCEFSLRGQITTQIDPISLHYARLERLARDEHSGLLDLFENYEGNVVS